MKSSSLDSHNNIRYERVDVLDVRSRDLREIVERRRSEGTPVLISGLRKHFHRLFKGFLRFDDETMTMTTNDSHMIKNMGKLNVPVRVPSNSFSGYESEEMKFETFLKKHWQNPESQTYLHQWQFALKNYKDSPRIVDSLLWRTSAALQLGHCIGKDMLGYYIANKNSGTTFNPMQYIFMGNESTGTHLHRDNGGLAIMIGVVVGEKEVIMMHRNDGHTGSTTGLLPKNLFDKSSKLSDYPMLAFNRLWRVTIQPGDILFMPAGTYHAVRNLARCFSVHRMHLDNINLPFFMQSMSLREVCNLDHAEILWNASHGIMVEIERIVDTYPDYLMDENLAVSLLDLKACIQIIHSNCFATNPRIDEFEWHLLLSDIEGTIDDCLSTKKEREKKKKRKRGGNEEEEEEDNIPSLPKTAFALYREQRVKETTSRGGVGASSKLTGSEWRSLSHRLLEEFREKAQRMRMSHAQLMDERKSGGVLL